MKKEFKIFIYRTIQDLYLTLDLETKRYTIEEIQMEYKRINNKEIKKDIALIILEQISKDFKL